MAEVDAAKALVSNITGGIIITAAWHHTRLLLLPLSLATAIVALEKHLLISFASREDLCVKRIEKQKEEEEEVEDVEAESVEYFYWEEKKKRKRMRHLPA